MTCEDGCDIRATDATKGPSGREDGAKVVLRLKRPEFNSRIGNTVRRAAILGILGLYSIYLLWLGLPVLMKSPPHRATGYTAAVVVIMFVIMFVVMLVVGRILLF